MKTIDATALAALTAGTAIVTGAVSFATSPAAYVWGGFGNITIGGDTYVGIGDAGTVVPVSFEVGGVESGVNLRLAGITDEVLALLAAEDLRGVAVVIRRLIFDQTGTTLHDSSVYFRGRCDNVSLQDTTGGESVATFDIEGSARGLNRSGARFASDNDQKLISATDNSFEAIATSPTKTLYWMGEPPRRAGQAVNRGITGIGRLLRGGAPAGSPLNDGGLYAWANQV